MGRRQPYPDRMDAADAVAERTAMRGLDRFARFVHLSPAGLWAKLLFPVVGLAMGAAVMTLLMWEDRLAVWGFLLAYLNPVGAIAGPAAGIALGIHPLAMIGMVLYLSAFGGLFLVWNMEHLARLPFVGPRLHRVEARGAEQWARRPWMRRLGFVGLTIYVLLPFPGTGTIAGAFVGRFSGFPWGLAWLALFLGASIRISLAVAAAYGITRLF